MSLQRKLRRWFAGTLPPKWEDAFKFLRSSLRKLEEALFDMLEEVENSASLIGRDGGQVLPGGRKTGSLTLTSLDTTPKTKIYFGSAQTSAFDELNSRLGIGDASPAYPLVVKGSVAGDAISTFWNTSATGYSGIQFAEEGGTISFFFGVNNSANNVRLNAINSFPMVFFTQSVERLRLDSNGNVSLGTGALATTATDGFLYIPSCAGAPTGVPTSFTGRVPIIYDTTNNRLYVYSGGWKSALFA